MKSRREGRLIWDSDPEVWNFILKHYIGILAALNMLWEIAQLPLYRLFWNSSAAVLAYAVIHCTVGDGLIGLLSFLFALIVTRSARLSQWHWERLFVATTAIGLVYTIFSEWLNTAIRLSWSYSDWMPVTPLIPIGLSPLLQWMLVPTVALILARRFQKTSCQMPNLKRPSENAIEQRESGNGAAAANPPKKKTP